MQARWDNNPKPVLAMNWSITKDNQKTLNLIFLLLTLKLSVNIDWQNKIWAITAIIKMNTKWILSFLDSCSILFSKIWLFHHSKQTSFVQKQTVQLSMFNLDWVWINDWVTLFSLMNIMIVQFSVWLSLICHWNQHFCSCWKLQTQLPLAIKYTVYIEAAYAYTT